MHPKSPFPTPQQWGLLRGGPVRAQRRGQVERGEQLPGAQQAVGRSHSPSLPNIPLPQALRPCHPQDAPPRTSAPGPVLLPRVVRPRGIVGLGFTSFPSLLLAAPPDQRSCALLQIGHQDPGASSAPVPTLTETPPLGSQWTPDASQALPTLGPPPPWTNEPRGLVGSGWQCGPPRPPDPWGRRSSWSGWVGAAGGGCPYILDVSAPLWGFEG